MDTTIIVALVTGIFGIISAILVAYVSAAVKFRKDLEAEYDRDLRKRRIELYTGLWEHLQVLARYDLPKPLNQQTLQDLSVAMRKWYFDEAGGLYLSDEGREDYFDLKHTIQEIVENNTYKPEETFNQQDSTNILTKGSLLRARLKTDVGTGKSSPVADS